MMSKFDDIKSVPEYMEFVKQVDFFINELHCSKKYLAKCLGISQSHLSRLYHGKERITPEMLNNIKKLCDGQETLRSRKIAVQEELPSMPNQARENVMSQRNYEAEILHAINNLSDRVTDLEKDLKQNKDDSEKKTRAIVTEAIRDEVERIAAEFSDRSPGRREAANDR